MKRSSKQIIVLLIIFLVIIFSYYSYKFVKEKFIDKKKVIDSSLVFENFNPESINHIYVEDSIGGTKFELSKDQNIWRFVNPKEYKTDNSIIQTYLTGFQQLYFKEKFEIGENTTLEAFGLDKPQKTFVFNYSIDGKSQKTGVIFGDTTPSRDGLYLKVIDKPEIYVITLEAIQLIDFNANHLRNKQVFSNVKQEEIKFIKFINKETKDENIIEYNDNNYYFTASYNTKASKLLIPAESIKSILDRIFYLSATDVKDELPEKYQVEYEIIIGTKDGNTINCIIFKKEKSADDYMELYYAINKSTNEIFIITLTTIKTFFTQKPYLLSELINE
ncbi:MAG: DUF4340 domain-containing protein [Exilispira sp.]